MKTLSIVIPVYNEAARIRECLTSLQTYTFPKGLTLREIIFVDDGSTDRTVRKIAAAKKGIERNTKATVTVVSLLMNQGKGFAVKTGMAESTADYTLFVDADMATPIDELTKFIPAMKKGIDVIVGTRKNGHSTVVVHQPKYREIFGKVFTYLSNVILNTWVTDFTCGFKAFSRVSKDKIFPRLTADRWGFDSESLFLARRMEFSIAEVAVTWSDRKGSKVNVLVDGPKSFVDLLSIRVRHAWKANTSVGAKYRMRLIPTLGEIS